MSNSQNEDKCNYLLRLFRGDIPLVVTYWVFGVLIGNVAFTIGNAAIEHNYMAIVSTSYGEMFIYIFYWFAVAYGLFVLMSVWRSAGKYQGNSTWSVLARVAVIFGALVLIVSFSAGLQQSNDSDFALEEEIRLINKSLPVLVDNGTRLDNASLIGKDVYYNYTLVNWTIDALDIEKFNTVMMPMVKTNVCEDAELRSLVDDDRIINYIYRDKNNRAVSKITVSKSDCL